MLELTKEHNWQRITSIFAFLFCTKIREVDKFRYLKRAFLRYVLIDANVSFDINPTLNRKII